MVVKGQIIAGSFGKLIARQKKDRELEIGELLVAETETGKVLLQVYDLLYGSQISQQNLELISGLELEEDNDLGFMDPALRIYNLAQLKSLVLVDDGKLKVCKTLPKFFSTVSELRESDLGFLHKPRKPLFIGKLRSGSKVMQSDLEIDGEKAFSHHILIAATTGRGKSNLTKCMLWDSIGKEYCGILVLDPHDEYYGRSKEGMKDHTKRDQVVFYSANAPPGTNTLKINLRNIKPWHFNGVVYWSDPQQEALQAYYKKFQQDWILAILLEKEVEGFHEGTLNVLRRRMMGMLDLTVAEDVVEARGIFDTQAGQSTVHDIAEHLENGKMVIIDTSNLSGNSEILVGSIITTDVFNRYRKYKAEGTLKEKPVISIVLEEAPRVLGKEALERGSNIFSTIAREGRKFKVGLTAITQLPSLIPRAILANMNTKIVLGLEMKAERQSIIESAAQDLSDDDRNIASLDIGEAIVTSNFVKFATPIKIPLFEGFIEKEKEKGYKVRFSGMGI